MKLICRSIFRVIYLCVQAMVEGTIKAQDGEVTLKAPKTFIKPKNIRLLISTLQNLDISCPRTAAYEGIYIMTQVSQAVVTAL